MDGTSLFGIVKYKTIARKGSDDHHTSEKECGNTTTPSSTPTFPAVIPDMISGHFAVVPFS